MGEGGFDNKLEGAPQGGAGNEAEDIKPGKRVKGKKAGAAARKSAKHFGRRAGRREWGSMSHAIRREKIVFDEFGGIEE